jgi:hypothetical protein
MKPKTGQYLARAESNRRLALAAIAPDVRALATHLPYEWVLVIAWHAAIDYVQALIYERHGVEHANHHLARRKAFDREPEAQSLSSYGSTLIGHYDRLENWANQARYTLGFTAHPIDADEALHQDVDAIRTAVSAALSWTLPT